MGCTGEITIGSGQPPRGLPTIRFPGQYYDEETGLHYNRFRYYDPGIGRYISADPIGQRGGVNLYTYAGNSPTNLIDPYGLIWKTTGSRSNRWRNAARWYAGRWREQIRKGMDPTVPGADPNEYWGQKQETEQEWVPDPANPERDSEYPYGTTRTIPQTWGNWADDLAPGGKSWHYDPVVPDTTYEDFPGQEITPPIFPPPENMCPIP